MTENYLSSEMSALFLMDAPGLKANFQGCLQVSDVEQVDGALTTHYCTIGNLVIPVGQTRGMPEPLRLTISGPLEILRRWMHRKCPFSSIVGWKKCAVGLELAQWDDEFDYLMYFPSGTIERKGVVTPLTKGLNEASAIAGGRVVIHVAEWLHWERHDAWKLPTEIECNISAIAYCGGPVCDSPDPSCGRATERGCCRIWVGGEAGVAACLYYSDDCGVTWVDASSRPNLGGGNGGPYDVTAILCEGGLVIVADSSGGMHYSHDGGATFNTSGDIVPAVRLVSYWNNIYAAGLDGLWLSRDRGITWTQLVDDMFVDLHWSTDFAVAATATDVYISTDGLRWSTITATGMAAQASAHVTPNGRIFVGGTEGMAYTRDLGQTWYAVDYASVCEFWFRDDFVGCRLLKGAAHALEITLDGGYSWHPWLMHGWSDEEVCLIAACDDRVMFGGAAGFLAEMMLYEAMITDPGVEVEYEAPAPL